MSTYQRNDDSNTCRDFTMKFVMESLVETSVEELIKSLWVVDRIMGPVSCMSRLLRTYLLTSRGK